MTACSSSFSGTSSSSSSFFSSCHAQRLSKRAGPPRPFAAHAFATRASACSDRNSGVINQAQRLLIGLAASGLALAPLPSLADVRLPPLDNDPFRCERAYTGNTIGQANAVSDKVLDLRECKLSGKDLSGKTLSGALMSDADLSKSNLQEAVLTKAYAVGANFSGADLTNAVVDRVAFDKADLSNVKFVNAVITGATFKEANLDGAVFEDALIGNEDVKRLCLNPTLTGDSRAEVGCREGTRKAVR